MANIKQNRIEIRGLTDDEINYLKALAEKNKAKSFNDFLLSICREKIEYGKFNRAQDLYVAHLENMKLASDHVLEQMKKQTRILSEFEKNESLWRSYFTLVRV
ncbi:hypothetical protein STYK_04670 [Streptococcus toyakuensis]|uniref:DUF1778 domain-containing protein n=1 Tax=Streptococcus toyakuensis TaxID=2819619 RepID=A0ABN6KJ78_9STRE|nr:hypothetical protein STYK_04670 [Streptococcus toyakuensis]